MTEKQLDNRMKFIEGLRDLIGVYEANPQLIAPSWKQNISVWVSSYDDKENPNYVKDTYKDFIKALGGTEKESSNFTFELAWEYGLVNFRLCTERDNVCERVVTGTKVIPAQEEQVIPATEERIEEVYEWKCTSLLK